MTAPKAMTKRTPEQIHAMQGYPSRLMLPAPQIKKHFFTAPLSGEKCFRFVNLVKQVAPTIIPVISFRAEIDGFLLGSVFCKSLNDELFLECQRIERKVRERPEAKKITGQVSAISRVKVSGAIPERCEVCGTLMDWDKWDIIDKQIICDRCAEDFQACALCGEPHKKEARLCSDCLQHEAKTNMAS